MRRKREASTVLDRHGGKAHRVIRRSHIFPA
jgi:hypothetical protein